MNIKKVLEKIDFAPSKEEIEKIKKETGSLCISIEEEIKKQKIKAEVFVGGSLAKKTLVKREKYDIDIFVRFDLIYENLSKKLENIISKMAKKKKLKVKFVHGSRDYIQIEKGNAIFEIIPVLKINKPKEGRNVTDLSYFHVNYIKRRTNEKIAREIIIAKVFCNAQSIYGAESYINGFSGYGLECLIIYYKSFEKMLREFVKVQKREIIDPEKIYKRKDNVLLEINESKLQSPIILVDPTWKERNVLAALSKESFHKFQEAAKAFLKNPNKKFFEEKKIDNEGLEKEAKNKKAEFCHVILKTDRQTGDIAGTKLKKFSYFLIREIERYFFVLRNEFFYDGKHGADFYLIVKSKKEIVKIGPPIDRKKDASAFRKRNRNVFEKNGSLHSKIIINFSLKKFLRDYKRKNVKKVREMGITGMQVLK
ncbi:nucleotidyltransferase domain-containing protein [Candidatus Pacearchaeota archaeon]|nr:nucleotidyltransferase domain-containing protein [Candidatus Pacearchaeota archaeon]